MLGLGYPGRSTAPWGLWTFLFEHRSKGAKSFHWICSFCWVSWQKVVYFWLRGSGYECSKVPLAVCVLGWFSILPLVARAWKGQQTGSLAPSFDILEMKNCVLSCIQRTISKWPVWSPWWIPESRSGLMSLIWIRRVSETLFLSSSVQH